MISLEPVCRWKNWGPGTVSEWFVQTGIWTQIMSPKLVLFYDSLKDIDHGVRFKDSHPTNVFYRWDEVQKEVREFDWQRGKSIRIRQIRAWILALLLASPMTLGKQILSGFTGSITISGKSGDVLTGVTFCLDIALMCLWPLCPFKILTRNVKITRKWRHHKIARGCY